MPRDYRSALEYLFARTTGDTKFGLERTQAMLELLGDPHRAFRSFHVAGTNGKGSVTATIEALLRARGLRVGSYTSPHLVDFRERIRVDGAAIPEHAVFTFIERWTVDAERLGATFFEVTTALAFDWFAASDVDVAVVETGLGGRLDATNVLTPLVAGVTSIALEHTEMLGATLSAIAFEKAGIFKAGVPAIIGERDDAVAAELEAHARSRGAHPVRRVAAELSPRNVAVSSDGTQFTVTEDGDPVTVRTPLIGEHQAWNTATAMAMVRAAGGEFHVPARDCSAALAGVVLPGRFDQRGQFVFDVAHNPAGIGTLCATLARAAVARPLVVLMGVLSDKDWCSMIDQLAGVADELVLATPPSAPPARRWDPAEAASYAAERGMTATEVHDFGSAIDVAASRGRTVLVTGSFHTVGDAMSWLQLSPTAA